jgi:GrpB-like predicted nucleotidyltransferase (UPF0157 family)
LLAHLGPALIRVEHMGSTAIPGLAAKPIIDLMAAVNDLADVPALFPSLRELGYDYVDHFEHEMPERRFFQRHNAAGERTHHLHIYDLPTFYARPERVFCDYVRQHPAIARDYETLKRDLAERLGDDRAAYTEAKTNFIQNVTSRALIHRQVALEYGIDAQGDLIHLPASAERARYVIYRFNDQTVHYFHPAVPAPVREQLSILPPATAFEAPATVQALLGSSDASPWMGTAYTLSRAPERQTFPDVIQEADRWVVRVQGALVSWAWSVRANALAAEAAVETALAFRGRGYARQVITAWLYHTLLSGRLPFYSHAQANTASAALARSVRLRPFAEAAAYP